MIKHLRKILIIVLILAGLVCFAGWCLDRYFFKTGGNYSPELYEFNPIDFDFSANKPIYYYSENNLFYDSLGKLNMSNQPIWSGKIAGHYEKHVYVSPNSEYIVINIEDKSILLLDKSGKIIHEIAPINQSFVNGDRKSGNFWGENLVWNESSTILYYMQDKNWVSNFSDDNRTSLFSFSTITNEVIKIIDLDIECTYEFYLSRDELKLYFQFSDDNGDLPYKKINLKTKKEIETYYRNANHKLEIQSDSIFINYMTNHFGNFSQDYQHLITTVPGRNVESGMYYYSDSLTKLIVKGKYGYGAFKGYHYSFLEDGEILPGNKFYIGRLKSQHYNGTIIIDLITKRYSYIDKKIECFYSITNTDQPDFQRREFETSKQLKIDKIRIDFE